MMWQATMWLFLQNVKIIFKWIYLVVPYKQAFYVMSHVFVMCFASQISCDWITKEIVCDFIRQILAYAVVIHLISHENYHAFVSIFLKVALRSEWPHAVVDFYLK